MSGAKQMQRPDQDIGVHQLAEMRDTGAAHTVLDIREPDELAVCIIDGSVTIPMQRVPDALDGLPRETPLIIVCHHGVRSAMVTAFLRRNGFDNALNLASGIDAWARDVEPDMPRY
ncbi:MAG: rhodanese-like domain-containing protein [Pseudomonadota bacterium]